MATGMTTGMTTGMATGLAAGWDADPGGTRHEGRELDATTPGMVAGGPRAATRELPLRTLWRAVIFAARRSASSATSLAARLKTSLAASLSARLAVGGRALLRRRPHGHAAPPQLRIVERVALGPKQSLLLVEAAGERLLVATGGDGQLTMVPVRSAVPVGLGRRRASW